MSCDLETVALALAENRRWDEAIQIQHEAIIACGEEGDPGLRARLPSVLRCMEAHKLWSEPWPFRNMS